MSKNLIHKIALLAVATAIECRANEHTDDPPVTTVPKSAEEVTMQKRDVKLPEPRLTLSVERITDRRGEPSKRGLTVPTIGKEWEFLEGSTLASIQMRVDKVTPKHFPEGICLKLPLKVLVLRGFYRMHTYVEISIVHPVSGEKVSLRPLSVRESLVCSIPKSIITSEGPRELFSLTKNESLSIQIRGVDSAVWYGFNRNKFRVDALKQAKPCEAKKETTRIKSEPVKSFDELVRLIDSARKDWRNASFELQKHVTVIPLETANKIRLRTEAQVRGFADTLNEQRGDLKKEVYWKQRIIVSFLGRDFLGKDITPSHIAKAAIQDGVKDSGIYLSLAWDNFFAGNIEDAKHAETAFRLDPNNAFAYVIAREIHLLNDTEFKTNPGKLSQQDLMNAKDQFTRLLGGGNPLPWRELPPIDKTVRRFEWRESTSK